MNSQAESVPEISCVTSEDTHADIFCHTITHMTKTDHKPDFFFLNCSITSADFTLLAAELRWDSFQTFLLCRLRCEKCVSWLRDTGLVESDTVAKRCNYSLMGSFFLNSTGKVPETVMILIHLV